MEREEVFDADDLYFYETRLTDERSDQEAELVWDLLGLSAGMEVLDLACGHGRIANRLAERGARVTGLDATPLFPRAPAPTRPRAGSRWTTSRGSEPPASATRARARATARS
ncbi:MAG TPA: methyltransferase domain-containing protein [Gaiellaceae bacterium]|nr:methyltransferase domain-containing protein [Gaiellaceae bacterium]